MKKQIISLLIFISLSCQSTYPVPDTVEQKKSDTIAWWRLRKLYNAFREAKKGLDLCGAQQCKQEKAEADEAFKAWRQISLGKKLSSPSLKSKAMAKNNAYQACLRLHCKQEYPYAHMLDEKFAKAFLAADAAALVATLGLQAVLWYFQKKQLEKPPIEWYEMKEFLPPLDED